jgi:ABC-2 type transport system ATP-binding protein
MIRLEHFSKIYGSGKNCVEAVKNVSFTAERGKVTALLGPNGAGKTTIIRAVCGLHYATSGRVLVGPDEDNLCDAFTDSAGVRNLTGYVPEQPKQNIDLTVMELLFFTAGIFGLSPSEKKNAIKRVLSICFLDSVTDKKLGSLSKGFRQRVALALALVNDPPILVLDEPSEGLDPVQINQIRTVIRELGKTKTILLSTHLMQEVAALCTDILIVAEGSLRAHGTAEKIAATAGCTTLEDAFIKITQNSEYEQK